MSTRETKKEIRRLINSLPKGTGVVVEVKEVLINRDRATIKAIKIDDDISYLGLNHNSGEFFIPKI